MATRAAEYKTQFHGVSARAASSSASKFHLRRPPDDFIPANAVAIPQVYTHQRPKSSTFARSVYSLLNTPNVSTVYGDGGLSSHEVTQQQLRPRSKSRSRSAAAIERDKRALEQSVEIVAARNRELELQVLDLRRELSMVKSSRSSSSARRRLQRRSDVSLSNTAVRDGNATIGKVKQLPGSARSGEPRSLEKTLLLLESLKSAILTRQSAASAISSAALPVEMPARENKKKRKKKTKRGHEDVHAAAVPPAGSTSVSIPSAISYHRDPSATRHQPLETADNAGALTEQDATFDAIQKNYWLHSRSMLSQLDRMLADAIQARN